jgi:hypothetical protein
MEQLAVLAVVHQTQQAVEQVQVGKALLVVVQVTLVLVAEVVLALLAETLLQVVVLEHLEVVEQV